ncbi:unnamed protein product [Ascophyllum nodosum]
MRKSRSRAPLFLIFNKKGSEPGSSGLRNARLYVDSNRLSDGVSSVYPLSTSSPSFPFYVNTTDDDGDEWARTRAKMIHSSRMAQGVSPRGAGSFDRAVARSNLLSGNYSSEKPFTSFAVNSWERWNPSAFAIQEGETYTVSVPGEQYWTDGRIRSDANGYHLHYDAIDACWVAVGRCQGYLGGSKPRVAPPRARWMQLVCGIGDFIFLAREALSGHERYLPLRDAALQDSLLPIGRNLTFLANYTGELICFANDAEGLYGNNRASLNVTVIRESWPPSGNMEEPYVDFI